MDINYNALFELDTEPGGTSTNTPENPAEADGGMPSNEQDDAGSAPEGMESDSSNEGKSEDSDDASDDVSEGTDAAGKHAGNKGITDLGKKQSASENARYAAARRKAEAERDAAIESERQKAATEIEGIIKSLHLADPETGKEIATREEYEAFKRRQSLSERDRLLRRSGLSKEQFDKFIGELPEVTEARRIKAEAEAVKREAEEARAKAKVEEQIREIAEMDPSIKGIADLTKMQNYDTFYELVKKGNTLVDAYKLATYDARMQNAAELAKKQTAYAADSKNHLIKTGTRGSGAVTVPPDIKEQYRLFNPDATDAEIQAHYSKYHKA